MTDYEFEKCISEMKRGNRDGLKLIYQEYIKLIYAVMYDKIHQKEEAEDLTADFFIKLLGLAGKYKSGLGHKKWLVTIARNMAIDRVRKLGRETPVDEIPELLSEERPFSEEIISNISVKEAMEKLAPGEREIVDLKICGGFTFREISEITGRPTGTVAWAYNNAINKLRRCRQWE